MADLTPRTRSESFLNGEDLEPITRREHFYAGRENELPEGHQEPETREEWFIQKYREAGDVTVESLSVTENGTYTAPSGKAYSPVSVNVPLPSNAYLLQSIEHEQVATFSDGTDNFIKSLEVAIEPVQSGSGDPSPENIRPIIGWDEVNVTVADDVDNPTVENVYTISLNGTRYGGKLDVVNGVLTVDKGYVDLGTLNWGKSSTEATVLYTTITGKKTGVNPMICDRYKYERDKGFGLNFGSVSDSSNASYVGYTFIRNSDFAGKTAVESATLLSGTQLVYELATPQTIQLTPTIIKSLQGDNNLFASTGEIEMLQYWGEVS